VGVKETRIKPLPLQWKRRKLDTDGKVRDQEKEWS
jgi:hypothetical protein